MGSIESELFGEVPLPETFEELISLLLRPPAPENGIVRMWRGQSDVGWPIHSSAYRRLAIGGKTPTESSLTNYERRLLERATHRGFRYVEGRRLSDFELLARLQHHGAATRLVDASRNALVALFFCANSLPRTTGALIGLHADYLGGYEEETQDGDYSDVVLKLASYRYPQTWEPPRVSNRISAQHSQFLYSCISTSKRGSLFIDDNAASLVVIGVSPELKRQSLSVLSEVFDIRTQTLFPDIDGFGQANAPWASNQGNYRW